MYVKVALDVLCHLTINYHILHLVQKVSGTTCLRKAWYNPKIVGPLKKYYKMDPERHSDDSVSCLSHIRGNDIPGYSKHGGQTCPFDLIIKLFKSDNLLLTKEVYHYYQMYSIY